METMIIFLLGISLVTGSRASTLLKDRIQERDMTVATYLDLSERSYINMRKQMEILEIDFNITIADVPNRIRNQIRNHLSYKVDRIFPKNFFDARLNDIDECIVAANEIHYDGISLNATKLVETEILKIEKKCEQNIDSFKQILNEHAALYGALWESAHNCSKEIRVGTFTCRKELSKKINERLFEILQREEAFFREKLSDINQQIRKIEQLCDNVASNELLLLEPYKTHVEVCIKKKLGRNNSTGQGWRSRLISALNIERIKDIFRQGVLHPFIPPIGQS